MSRVDLHIHSTASDGKYTPAEIVRQAAAAGLRYIALADHDSVDGIAPAIEAAKAFPQLTFIPGVEVSTDVSDGEIHVLGYFIDYAGKELGESLKKFRASREGRGRAMVDKLAGLGINVDWGRVREIAGGGAIGRPHVAQAMLEKGYIGNFKEAFDKYIGRVGPAYVEREKMTPAEAVMLVLRSGGLPVLAHPFTVADPEKWIIELKKAGLAGIEGYYKDNTPKNTRATLALAEKYGLTVTGGSDFHGIEGSREVGLGGVDVPLSAARRLIKQAKKSGSAVREGRSPS
ncbi:MAG: phosphatase [Chloroflexi bacterium RBG_13_57_8]|nr:MAG: phosphatase [Chloroflexi bacterium RBG_13_57_8]